MHNRGAEKIFISEPNLDAAESDWCSDERKSWSIIMKKRYLSMLRKDHDGKELGAEGKARINPETCDLMVVSLIII